MIYWTLTEMNIKADDELTLSHIPYMGESDKSFTKDLMEAFPDGIHGTKVGCGEYINDFILYHTVKYCEDENSEIRKFNERKISRNLNSVYKVAICG
jgi:hypothetical protein